MSDQLFERLMRFTPDPGKLDRDALLFAAGRSSARPNRSWKWLAAVLAGTQALSLLLLLPRVNRPADALRESIAAVPVPQAAPELPATRKMTNLGLWTARHSLLNPEVQDRPAGGMTLIDSGMPLGAIASRSSSLVN
jgi:hypothetical protein